MIEHFLKNYDNKSFYLKQKAMYSFFVSLIIIVAIITITMVEAFVYHRIFFTLFSATFSLLGFGLVLFSIYKGRFEVGSNLMLLLGLIRIVMIISFEQPFQFIVMIILIALAMHLIYVKAYQIYTTNTAILALIIYKGLLINQNVLSSHLPQEAFTEYLLSMLIFMAVLILLNYIRALIKREIQEREQLLQYAELDPLTNLYNRRKITEIFDDIQIQNKDYDMILFDIDDFKQFNDSYGHALGDLILSEIAKIICENFPEIEASRWGGEEFLLLIPSHLNLGESIRKAIEERRFLNQYGVTVSLGQSSIHKEDTILTASNRADKAMYQAKALGKNTLIHYKAI